VRSLRATRQAVDPVTRIAGKWPAVARNAAAVSVIVISVLISLWLRPYSYATPFLPFFPAVIIAAWIGRLGPGLLATGVATLAANYGELRQVFSNLVANAIEAMGPNGHLKLHVCASANWADNDRRGLRVVIADNGHGTSPGARAKLFEPFFTTKGQQGTGLGLWLTQAIVRKHQGLITLHSSVRQGRTGTCFSVFLPLDRAKGESAAHAVV
jgi:signal transduction histidine kinase